MKKKIEMAERLKKFFKWVEWKNKVFREIKELKKEKEQFRKGRDLVKIMLMQKGIQEDIKKGLISKNGARVNKNSKYTAKIDQNDWDQYWLEQKDIKKDLLEKEKIYDTLVDFQKLWRVRKEYQQFQRLRKCVRKIQIFYKKRYMERKARQRRNQVKLVQSYIKRYHMYKLYRFKYLKSVVKIEALFRGHKARLLRRKLEAVRLQLKVLKQFLSLLLSWIFDFLLFIFILRIKRLL